MMTWTTVLSAPSGRSGVGLGNKMRYAGFLLLLVGMTTAARAAGSAVPEFNDYPAGTHTGNQAASIDWSSNPDAARFKTRLERAFKKGAKFAGHYAVATWHCGTDCQVMAIVDVSNGRITFGPNAELDFAFHRNSRLLIANSPAAVRESLRLSNGCPGRQGYWAVTSHYYQWTGRKFEHIRDINVCAGKHPEGVGER